MTIEKNSLTVIGLPDAQRLETALFKNLRPKQIEFLRRQGSNQGLELGINCEFEVHDDSLERGADEGQHRAAECSL